MSYKRLFLILISLLFISAGFSQSADFSKTTIFLQDKKNVQLQKAVQVLSEEVKSRSNLLLPVTYKPATDGQQSIIVGVEERMERLPENIKSSLSKLPATGKDGYKIVLLQNKTIVIAGHDERGALYGVGKLLRKMDLNKGVVLVPGDLNRSESVV